MKAVFITYSQAYNEEIVDVLDSFGQRGFTRWTDVGGRGSVDGLPHYGNHTWPEINQAIITFVEDDAKAADLIRSLKELDGKSPDLGLRAFAWNVENYF